MGCESSIQLATVPHFSHAFLSLSCVFMQLQIAPSSSRKTASLFSRFYKLPSSQPLSFDILTNAPGVGGARDPVFSANLYFPTSNLCLFKLFRTLLRSSKTQPFSFHAIPHSFAKNRGVWVERGCSGQSSDWCGTKKHGSERPATTRED
jgi:hypothetical protein